MTLDYRVIVVGLVRNDQGEYLLCKMPAHRGVFPNQWGLPGGGIEPGERLEEALRREMREELGIEITNIRPLIFKDGTYRKTFSDATTREIYMIFLLFECWSLTPQISPNEEFCEYAWVDLNNLDDYELNIETQDTLNRLKATAFA